MTDEQALQTLYEAVRAVNGAGYVVTGVLQFHRPPRADLVRAVALGRLVNEHNPVASLECVAEPVLSVVAATQVLMAFSGPDADEVCKACGACNWRRTGTCKTCNNCGESGGCG